MTPAHTSATCAEPCRMRGWHRGGRGRRGLHTGENNVAEAEEGVVLACKPVDEKVAWEED